MPADPASRNTILHAASFYGILPLVQDLVAIEGLDINQANNDLDTPLHLAMQAGHPDVVLLLLEKSANSKLENARGETPLHWLGSIEESRLDEVCSSIVASSRLAHLFDRDSISSRIGLISPELSSLDEEPLFKVAEVSRAVLNPSLGPLSSLLACSASVLVILDPVIAHTLCLRLVCEPMKLAAELYLYKAFDLLCRTCLTVWHCLLEREGASNLPGPLRAAFKRSRESPRVGGDLIVTWMDANPFLHGAIVTQIDMLRILCHGRERDDAAAKGINKADQTGLTPIDAALEDRQFAALALLAARGAHLDLRRVRDPNHRLTPTEPSYLHLLASLRVEDTAFVNLILDYGVPVSVRDKNGLDPLHLALARSSFAMARVLLANGASLSNGEPFDLTPLGRVFYPMFAEQFDDLRSTLKFILDYERSQGLDLFIVQKGTNLNVLHSMASYYPDDPSYPELVDMVLKHYHEPRRINAPASTASKTTPLETAIVRNNHIAVRRLLEAGANPTQPDFRGTAPIDLALEQVLKLSQAGGEPSKRDALNRALIVVEVIAEKTSWPACLNPLRHALETATPLLEMLRKSQHNVASARKLETSVLDAVFTAIPRNQQGVEYTYLARHLVNLWAKGSIYLHITSRALCSTEDVDLKKSYNKELQLSAAFEFMLDLSLRNWDGKGKTYLDRYLPFALSRDTKDLPEEHAIMRYPPTLTEMYRRLSRSREVVPTQPMKSAVHAVTNGYRAYAASKEGESPESTHWGWFSAVRAGSDPESRPPRFEWGDFSALSYSWGSPDDIKTITLNGRPSPVGANLEAALRALRNEPHFAAGLRLWVDALCINQTDLAEKSQVLPIMQMLYREASTVTVWLGAPNDTSDDDLEALSKFAGIPHESILQHASLAMGRSVQSLAPLAYSQTILPALVNIIDRPYWTRMWVMQELTRSSPEKQLFIGSKSIWWDELREVMVHYISHVLGDPAYDVDSFDEVTLNRAMHATQHVTLLVVSDSMWRLFPQRADVVTDLGYWKSFLHNAALAGVGDERDRVYGLLSLMPPQMAAHIQPDYTKSVGEVYTDLSAAAIKGLRERAYSIVFVGHRSQPPPGTPSWACALEPHQPVPIPGTPNQAGGREGIFDILAGHAQGARSEEGGADTNRPNEGGDGVRREVELESGDVESNSVKPFPLETVDEMYSFVTRARFLDKDRNCFFHTVIPFDTVDGIGGPIDLGSGWCLDLPVKYPSRELHVYDNPVQSLARILAGDIYTGHRRAQRGSLVESPEAAPDNEREDDHSSMEALLSIPWFESYAPSAIEEQEFVDAGWGDLLSTSHFAIFHRFRLQHRDFPLWKDVPFQAFFPPDASVLRNAEMHTPGKINEVASALRAVKWVVERTFISTKEKGLLGSTSRGVRQGDQLVAIVGCPFVVAIREVESDKAQELREKLALDASVRICKVIGECYVEGVMNAELLRDGYLAEHLEEVMFL
ncbi:hypothetical protein NEMBOFW57_010374 [Staphylotrichum longicolle]|uniref:Heterokaryon incompatibility domain-containing protein n=1 Tax=Staphylotrichum longicolle TaxID=669026 RepID=A0AAD4EMY6_9PEZI|nr:hypothetical protein NEMBOFW57_010374 [Staphylotrichum longicolle]